MHESIEELQCNDHSVTGDIVLVSHKFEEDEGLCLGNDDEKKIKPKKFHTRSEITKDVSATDELLLLASQKSEGNQGWYLKNDDEDNQINKSL